MSNKYKKGQTLVEVMVALSILIIVLSGVIELLINSVNLVLNARSKTEAIAIVQNGMSEGISSVQGTCQIRGYDNAADLEKAIIDRTSENVGDANYLVVNTDSHNKYKLTVKLKKFVVKADNTDIIPAVSPTLASSDIFGIVVSKVIWTDKNNPAWSSSYELSQLVRLR